MIMTCVNYCAKCIICLPAPLLSKKIIFIYHHRYCHNATLLDDPNKNQLPVYPLRAPTHHADPPLPIILPKCFLCFTNITTIFVKNFITWNHYHTLLIHHSNTYPVVFLPVAFEFGPISCGTSFILLNRLSITSIALWNAAFDMVPACTTFVLLVSSNFVL